MTTLHSAPAPTTSATVLPEDPMTQYRHLTSLKGQWIILISGYCAFEGALVEVALPNRASDSPMPIITIDVGHGTVIGPVIAGDLVAVPRAVL